MHIVGSLGVTGRAHPSCGYQAGSSRHAQQQRVHLPQQFTNLRNFAPASSASARKRKSVSGEAVVCCLPMSLCGAIRDMLQPTGCRIYALDAAMSFDYEAKANARLKQQTALRIGIVGFGTFGQFLAKRLIQQGHKVSCQFYHMCLLSFVACSGDY